MACVCVRASCVCRVCVYLFKVRGGVVGPGDVCVCVCVCACARVWTSYTTLFKVRGEGIRLGDEAQVMIEVLCLCLCLCLCVSVLMKHK